MARPSGSGVGRRVAQPGRTIGRHLLGSRRRRRYADSLSALTRYLAPLAGRFDIVVSQELAAQAIIVVGAVGGAAVNLAFAEHFQTLARGHFTVRRLERLYGAEIVRGEYERLEEMS
jgi:hypothetical protein